MVPRQNLFVKSGRSAAILYLFVFLWLAFLPSNTPTTVAAAEVRPQTGGILPALSLDDRLACQTAVEAVYWNNRLWPAENPGPKPSFDEVVPAAAIEAKVENTLRRTNALSTLWQQEISGAMLQAEINRMAADTQQPEILAELWAALDNDPYLVAECLARPSLTNRLLRNFYEGSAEAETTSYSSWWAANAAQFTPETAADSATPTFAYTLPFITSQTAGVPSFGEGAFTEGAFSEGGDSWQATPAIPFYGDGRAVWSGSEILIFGGSGSNQGYLYDPATDTWDQMNMLNVPQGRREHSAVWTGTEMIVWGGCTGSTHACDLNTGGRYNPVTDTWTETAQPANVSSRTRHVAVWTGEVMVVWGGCRYAALDTCTIIPPEGGRYNPATDTWQTTSKVNQPSPRTDPRAVWTGSEMLVAPGLGHNGGRYDPVSDTWQSMSLVNAPNGYYGSFVWTGTEAIAWGGCTGTPNCQTPENSGGHYDPATDTWTPTGTTNAPSGRWFHGAVWTGDEMIVWGGSNGDDTLNDGGRYDPATDTWTPVGQSGAPSKRYSMQAIWTGDLMIIWGGRLGGRTGGRYNPATDSWTPVSKNDPGANRSYHAAVWTGTEMIIWGGGVGVQHYDFGSVYDVVTNEWWLTSEENAPFGYDSPSAVWTGLEMLVWGGNGSNDVNSGGRYNPATDTWTMMNFSNAPDGRVYHTAVWNGTEMIIWGGSIWTDQESHTGSRYNPTTDTWTATTNTNAPEGRRWHTAVWAGDEMIVWGGRGENGELNSGGRYDPATNTWTPITTTNAPSVREFHSAVWSGNEMVIWGGGRQTTVVELYNDGARYDPTTDTWTPATMTNAPGGRMYQTTVWTGEEMIVWGGCTNTNCFFNDTSGGRYNPAADTWEATNLFHAPEQRLRHTAVWTGFSMIVWGGLADQNGIAHTGGVYYPTAPANTAPAAADDDYNATENQTLTMPAPGVLDNDSDPDGDPLTAMLVSPAANGSLFLNHDGSFVYIPDPGFAGTDTFTYQAGDGQAVSNIATVTINVAEAPNNAPVAVDDDYAIQQDETLTIAAPGVLDNDSDPDGDPLTAALDTLPAHGIVTANPDGSFSYTPDTGYTGEDTFTYLADDGQDGTDTAVVTITVNEIGETPTYTTYIPFAQK